MAPQLQPLIHSASARSAGKFKIYPTDFATGAIIAYDLGTGDELERIMTNGKGIMGITTDASGDLWYVNGDQNTVTRVER
jgi:hypothetical protein